MANNNSIDPNKAFAAAVDPASTSRDPAKKNDAIGQQEFLTLLVNQLQNQDPLNPMNSEEFAVQLAQFSQLEQLISINGKLDGGVGGGSSVGDLAGLLGNEVVLNTQQVDVFGGKGPNLLVDAPAGTQSARIDFLDANGQTVGSHVVSEIADGRNIIKLDGVNVPNGIYDTSVVLVDGAGKFREVSSKVSGTVEGFVLEPEPALLVNGQEISLADVTEVVAGKGNV
jgi:flagellar basal-body rod modification protein FlgD